MPADTSWMSEPGTAQVFLQAVNQGRQAAAEKERLMAEQARTSMEAQARAEAQQQENLRSQARIQTEKAYRQQQLQLQQERLNQIQQEAAAKAKAAARTAMAHQKLNSLMQQGVPLEKALLQVPELASPQNLLNAHKETLDLGSQRLEQRKQEFAEKQAQSQLRAEAAAKKQTDMGEETTETITPGVDGGPETRKTIRRKVFGVPGDSSGLTPPPPATAPAGPRQAVGKYKIGATYKGGLKYLGGDPADEGSWQKAQ